MDDDSRPKATSGKKDDRSPWPERPAATRPSESAAGEGKPAGRGGRTGRGPGPRRDSQGKERGGRPPRREGPPPEGEQRPPRRGGSFLYGTPAAAEGRPPKRDRDAGPPRREEGPYARRPPQSEGRPPQGGNRPPRRKGSPPGERPPRREGRPPQGGERPPWRKGPPPQGGERPPWRKGRPSGEGPPGRGRRPAEGRDRPPRRGERFDDRRPPRREEANVPERPEGGYPWDPVQPQETEVGKKLAALDEFVVKIEKLVAGGDGLARFDGIPIFVPRSAPGDRLLVRLVERKSSFGRAEIQQILAPGPGRREPPCPHFERCGGCDLQHLEDDVQLRLKVQTVRENLLRIGHFEVPKDLIVVPGQSWGYRLRAQLHIAPSQERGNQVGYFARGSHDLVPVESCPVLVPELEALLPKLPRRVRDENHRRIDLVVGDEGLSVSPAVSGLPRGQVQLKVGEFTYTFDAGCFFQAHRQLLPQLVSYAVGELSGVEGDLEGEVFDLYSGVGLFSLPLSRRYRQVTAVEGERAAVRYARKTARNHKVTNVEFHAQAVETWADKLPQRPSRVVVDPPRVGLSKTVRRALLASRPRQITYISCNSATLGRDLADLTPIYRATRLVLLDLFPQTGHLEAVVQLVDREAES